MFCGLKKHILDLAPFLNRCYWPGWITYSSIRFNRIGWEFLPNSILTKTEIFHHFSSLCPTNSAVQFGHSLSSGCGFSGVTSTPLVSNLCYSHARKSVSDFFFLNSNMILPWGKDCQSNIRSFNVCLSLISDTKYVHFAGAKMFVSNCHCF